MMRRKLVFIPLLVALHIACGGGEPATLMELQRVRSGNVDVVMLSSNETLRDGKDTAVVEFRSVADGRLVDVGDVQATATMPMAGMAPMIGMVDVTPTDIAGRYSMATDLSMAGDWRIGVEWNGPAGQGTASLSTSAQ
jgi:hypothetical protein